MNRCFRISVKFLPLKKVWELEKTCIPDPWLESYSSDFSIMVARECCSWVLLPELPLLLQSPLIDILSTDLPGKGAGCQLAVGSYWKATAATDSPGKIKALPECPLPSHQSVYWQKREPFSHSQNLFQEGSTYSRINPCPPTPILQLSDWWYGLKKFKGLYRVPWQFSPRWAWKWREWKQRTVGY